MPSVRSCGSNRQRRGRATASRASRKRTTPPRGTPVRRRAGLASSIAPRTAALGPGKGGEFADARTNGPPHGRRATRSPVRSTCSSRDRGASARRCAVMANRRAPWCASSATPTNFASFRIGFASKTASSPRRARQDSAALHLARTSGGASRRGPRARAPAEGACRYATSRAVGGTSPLAPRATARHPRRSNHVGASHAATTRTCAQRLLTACGRALAEARALRQHTSTCTTARTPRLRRRATAASCTSRPSAERPQAAPVLPMPREAAVEPEVCLMRVERAARRASSRGTASVAQVVR